MSYRKFTTTLNDGSLLARYLYRKRSDFFYLLLSLPLLILFYIVKASFEILKMLFIIIQVDTSLVFIDRRNNSLLDEFSIKLRVEKHVLNGARNILILLALHQRVLLHVGRYTVPV